MVAICWFFIALKWVLIVDGEPIVIRCAMKNGREAL